LRKNKGKRGVKNQSVGVFFQHQSPILRKSGKGIGKNQSVGVTLSVMS
jgi:hypothetical protein